MKNSLRVKGHRPLVLAGTGMTIICIALAIFYSYAHNRSYSEEILFCSGTNPGTGSLESVHVSEGPDGRGRIRVFSKSAGASELKFEDRKGFVHRDSAKGFPSRVSLQIKETEKLQVFRDCGEAPACRFEQVHYLSKKDFEQANRDMGNMENAAFEARKKTALLAEEYAVLRSEVQAHQMQLELAEIKEKLESKKTSLSEVDQKIQKTTSDLLKAGLEFVKTAYLSKKNKRDPASADVSFQKYRELFPRKSRPPLNYAELTVKEANTRFRKVADEANEVVGKLHSMSANTFDMHKHIKSAQESIKAKGTQIESTNLVPAQINEWCPGTMHSKMGI